MTTKIIIALIVILTLRASAQISVTSYGAVGNAIQFYANTTAGSVLVTTTNTSVTPTIGDSIEIFGAGTPTSGTGSYGTTTNCNMDLIGVITNITSITNLYVTVAAKSTTTNTFATYGHNNQTNIANCLAAAGAGQTITFPAGTFLVLGVTNATAYGSFGILLTNGNMVFSGAGPSQTILLGQGAWITNSYYGTPYSSRAFLFEEMPPIASNGLFVLQNMTLDGGAPNGNTQFHSEYANMVDGQGWDVTHDAFLVWSANSANAFNQMTWTNLVFQHWRGEMVKSIDGSTNGNLYAVNCTFSDGNATAINIYPSITFTNCLFNNLFQVAEYYQAYSTNTCYFVNNLCTNITGNEFAINGGRGNNPPFVIAGNTFYLSGNGNNGIETVPADNVLISNNWFGNANNANVIVLGPSGYQGTCDNSNIVICYNTITNPLIVLEVAGTNAPGFADVRNVSMFCNTIQRPNSYPYLLQTYGWATNILIFSNDCSSFIGEPVTCNSGIYGGQFALVSTNNLYFSQMGANSGTTNQVNYSAGSRFLINGTFTADTAFALVDTNAAQIPSNAQIWLVNSNASAASVPVYLSAASLVNPISLPVGNVIAATWNGSAWVTNYGAAAPPPQYLWITR